jgi:ubiquinone/menaquinone biosynthesis C-methylase UbiE
MSLATGYWSSAALLAAVKLRIFDLLADGPKTAEQSAQSLHGDLRAVSMLMDALAAQNLIERSAEPGPATYSNNAAVGAFLVSGKPGYMGSAIIWAAEQYAAWGSLAETVLSGCPAVKPELHLGEDPEMTRTFVLGMQNRAIGIARGVVHFLDLDGCTSLLDVGGGPGTYSVLLAEKYSNLNATVFDLPDVIKVARELIASSPAADRVTTRPGNAVKDEFGDAEFDAVLFSGVLHQMSPDTIRAMLKKAKRALKPGGRVIICDILLDSTRIKPEFATLFGLQMLLTSDDGHVPSVQDIKQWLARAGFNSIGDRPLPPPLPYVVVSGRVGDGERG